MYGIMRYMLYVLYQTLVAHPNAVVLLYGVGYVTEVESEFDDIIVDSFVSTYLMYVLPLSHRWLAYSYAYHSFRALINNITYIRTQYNVLLHK